MSPKLEETMQKGYVRRLYNLLFAITALATFFLPYQAIRNFLSDYIPRQTQELKETYRRAHDERRNQLIQQGKQTEADAYGQLSDHFVLLDFPITLNVSADPAEQETKWSRFRLRLLRNNQAIISLLLPLAAYIGLYFLSWHTARLLAQYVRGKPTVA